MRIPFSSRLRTQQEAIRLFRVFTSLEIGGVQREVSIERSLLGGLCVAGLGLLGQASMTLSNNSSQILDPNLVTGVLFGGALMIHSMVRPVTWTKHGDLKALQQYARESLLVWFFTLVSLQAAIAYWLASIVPLFAIAIEVAILVYALNSLRFHPTYLTLLRASCAMTAVTMLLVFTQSYWRGVSVLDIRKQVESFDGTQFWLLDDWADAARWLDNSAGGFDKQIALNHLTQRIENEPQTRDLFLAAAVRSGLESESAMLPHGDVQAYRLQIMNPLFNANNDQPFGNIQSDYFYIASTIASEDLTDKERETIANRLMANWNQLASDELSYQRIKNALWLTELFNRLDLMVQIERRRADVHSWLVIHQVTNPMPFHKGGGFIVTPESMHSDRCSTLAAITLMETYGVPRGLNISQLRAYLRPDFICDFQKYDYIPKKIAWTKLSKLHDVPPPNVFDYLQSELPLWLSILLVLLLAYATLSSPAHLYKELHSS